MHATPPPFDDSISWIRVEPGALGAGSSERWMTSFLPELDLGLYVMRESIEEARNRYADDSPLSLPHGSFQSDFRTREQRWRYVLESEGDGTEMYEAAFFAPNLEEAKVQALAHAAGWLTHRVGLLQARIAPVLAAHKAKQDRELAELRAKRG